MAKLSFTILIFTLLSVLDSVDTFDRITMNLLQAAKILVPILNCRILSNLPMSANA